MSSQGFQQVQKQTQSLVLIKLCARILSTYCILCDVVMLTSLDCCSICLLNIKESNCRIILYALTVLRPRLLGSQQPRVVSCHCA